jgi:hypothetical protein
MGFTRSTRSVGFMHQGTDRGRTDASEGARGAHREA